MVKRKVTILEPAITAVAEVAFFIESKGMPQTAKKFVMIIEHRLCTYKKWKDLNYRCLTYKKKYVIAYLSHENEVIICDFVSSKLLK